MLRSIAVGVAMTVIATACTSSHGGPRSTTPSVTCDVACQASKSDAANASASAQAAASALAASADVNFQADIVNIPFTGTPEEAIAEAHSVCTDLAAGGNEGDLETQVQTELTDQDLAEADDFINAAIASYCPELSQYELQPAPTTSEAPPPPAPKITFKITGNGSHAGVITYTEGTDIEQSTDARLPWKKTIDDLGDFYQVSAQDADGTSITCEIDSSDGTVLDKKTSTGRYAIAACSAHGNGP